MVLDAVIGARHELVRVMVGDLIDASARSYRSLVIRSSAQINLNMRHVMFLYVLWGVISGTVEDNVSRDHLLKLQINGQSVELVGLVSTSEHKAKLGSQVVYCSTNKRTTIEEYRRVKHGVVWLSVPLGIRYSNIFLAGRDELLPKPFLELW